jgi:hypothetical protein
MNTIPMSHIVIHNPQRLETKIRHNDEHIVNLMWIIKFQNLQKMFDHINNFNPCVILKDEDVIIKSMKSIDSLPILASKLIDIVKKSNNKLWKLPKAYLGIT